MMTTSKKRQIPLHYLHERYGDQQEYQKLKHQNGRMKHQNGRTKQTVLGNVAAESGMADAGKEEQDTAGIADAEDSPGRRKQTEEQEKCSLHANLRCHSRQHQVQAFWIAPFCAWLDYLHPYIRTKEKIIRNKT